MRKNNEENSKTQELETLHNIILDNLNEMLTINQWSIKKLADTADLPYESVKKLLAGKIKNPTVYTLYKICTALGCGIDQLMETGIEFGIGTSCLPERSQILLQEIATFESKLHFYNKSANTDNITVLVPTGRIEDGMIFDSISTESVDISAYDDKYKNIIMCGIKILGRKLHPTYLNNDILLVAKDRYPLNGEVGIFLIGHKVYIRKYSIGFSISLEPVNRIGEPIIITNLDDVHFFGRVVTVLRK